MAYSCVRVHFEIGHEASIRNKRTPEGFTHDWEVFVRGADNAEIHHFVEKVVFHLHDTFPKPKRTVKEPPYCVKESGYAGFNLAIDIYFKTREEGSRKLRLYYDLTLQPSGPRISNVIREQSDFTNPPEDFRRKLIKGGGVGIGNDGSSLAEKSSHNNNMLPSSQGSEDSKVASNPAKVKPGNPSEMPKKHKPKDNSKLDEPRLTNSFADLFGPPIKTGKHSPNPKSQSKTSASDSKLHEKQGKEKEGKSVKPSPLKDKDRDKNDKEKESSSIKKEKDLDKSSTKDKERTRDKEGHRDKEKLKEKSSKKSASPSVAPKETIKKEESVKRPPPQQQLAEENTPPPVKDKEKLSASKLDVKPEKEKKHKEKKNREEREKKDKHKEHEKKEVKEIEKEKVLERIERRPEPTPKEQKETKTKEKHKLVDKEEKKVKKLEKEKERNHDLEKQKHKHKKKDKHKKDEEKEKTKKKDKITMDKSPLERDVVKTKIKTPPSVKKDSPPPSPPPPSIVTSKPLNQLILEMSDKDTDSDFSGSGDDDLKHEPQAPVVERVVAAVTAPPPPPPVLQSQPNIPSAAVKIKSEMKAESFVKEEKMKRKKEKSRDEEREGKKRKKKNKDKEEPPEKQPKIEVKNEHDRSPSPDDSETTLFTDDYVTQLKDLQHKIMTLQDNADLQKVVQVISETGQFEITQRTFDFDLCALDPSTVKRLQDMFIAASS